MKGFDTDGYGWATEIVTKAVTLDPVLRLAAYELLKEKASSDSRDFWLGQLVWRAATEGLLWQHRSSQEALARVGSTNLEHVDFAAVATAVTRMGRPE